MNPQNRQEDPSHVKIFKYPFRVRIPQRELYGELDRSVFGIPTTGDHNVDRQLAEELTPVTMTIADLVTLWDRDVNFTFDSVDDIARMYGYINEHLRCWERAIREKIWMKEPPMEDLHKLDRFASFLFTRSRGRIARKFDNEALLTGLDVGSVSPISIGGANEVETIADQIRQSEHQSITTQLEQNLSRRYKAWSN